jgi:thioredoxin
MVTSKNLTLLTNTTSLFFNKNNKKFKMVENLTKETFIEKIFDYENNKEWNYKGEKPAVIDFYADWCGTCKMVAPILEDLATEFDEINIYKIDTGVEEELSQIFGVRSIPSILLIPIDGPPQMVQGAAPKDSFITAFEEIFNIKK